MPEMEAPAEQVGIRKLTNKQITKTLWPRVIRLLKFPTRATSRAREVESTNQALLIRRNPVTSTKPRPIRARRLTALRVKMETVSA